MVLAHPCMVAVRLQPCAVGAPATRQPLSRQIVQQERSKMKSIYKYPLEACEETILTLRGDVLSAGVQGNDIMVWAVHDDAAPERRVRVNVMGTGHLFVDAAETAFVNTVFLGSLVFHVFATR
jgi:hypothetical protein